MIDYEMSPRMHRFQRRVCGEGREFLKESAPEDSVLVLDSTGPSVMRPIVGLSGLGRDNVLPFNDAHAFSGGALAILRFLGLTSRCARSDRPELRSAETERVSRGFHHQQRLSIVRAWINVARRSSAFRSNKPDQHRKLVMLKDFVCLMSHLPNRNWGNDITPPPTVDPLFPVRADPRREGKRSGTADRADA